MVLFFDMGIETLSSGNEASKTTASVESERFANKTEESRRVLEQEARMAYFEDWGQNEFISDEAKNILQNYRELIIFLDSLGDNKVANDIISYIKPEVENLMDESVSPSGKQKKVDLYLSEKLQRKLMSKVEKYSDFFYYLLDSNGKMKFLKKFHFPKKAQELEKFPLHELPELRMAGMALGLWQDGFRHEMIKKPIEWVGALKSMPEGISGYGIYRSFTDLGLLVSAEDLRNINMLIKKHDGNLIAASFYKIIPFEKLKNSKKCTDLGDFLRQWKDELQIEEEDIQRIVRVQKGIGDPYIILINIAAVKLCGREEVKEKGLDFDSIKRYLLQDYDNKDVTEVLSGIIDENFLKHCNKLSKLEQIVYAYSAEDRLLRLEGPRLYEKHPSMNTLGKYVSAVFIEKNKTTYEEALACFKKKIDGIGLIEKVRNFPILYRSNKKILDQILADLDKSKSDQQAKINMLAYIDSALIEATWEEEKGVYNFNSSLYKEMVWLRDHFDIILQTGYKPKRYSKLIDGYGKSGEVEKLVTSGCEKAVFFVNNKIEDFRRNVGDKLKTLEEEKSDRDKLEQLKNLSEAIDVNFDVLSGELLLMFLSEGGVNVITSGKMEGLDGFGDFGADTFGNQVLGLSPQSLRGKSDNAIESIYKTANIKKAAFLAQLTHPSVLSLLENCEGRKKYLRNCSNERDDPVITITNLDMEKALYVAAAMYTQCKIESAGDLMELSKNILGKRILLSSLDRSIQFLWTNVYYNGGKGSGKLVLRQAVSRLKKHLDKGGKMEDYDWLSTMQKFPDNYRFGGFGGFISHNVLWRYSTYLDLRNEGVPFFREGEAKQQKEKNRISEQGKSHTG